MTDIREGDGVPDLGSAFAETIKYSDLTGVAKDLTEIGLDSLLKEGLLKEVPIVSSMVSIWNLGISAKEALFIRKLVAFFGPLENVSAQQRREMMDKLAESAGRESVGEKLFSLLDRLETKPKAELLSKAFVSYIQEKISDEEFWRISFVIDRLPLGDVEAILSWRDTDLNSVDHVRQQLYLSVGIGWFVQNASSSGFVWQERLCQIISDELLASG